VLGRLTEHVSDDASLHHRAVWSLNGPIWLGQLACHARHEHTHMHAVAVGKVWNSSPQRVKSKHYPSSSGLPQSPPSPPTKELSMRTPPTCRESALCHIHKLSVRDSRHGQPCASMVPYFLFFCAAASEQPDPPGPGKLPAAILYKEPVAVFILNKSLII
jgi:hypothetical protein